MRKVILLLSLAIVVIAGCVGGGREVKIDANNGLIFNDFSVDMDVVREDDGEFNLYMDVENVGEKTADNIRVDVYGINWKVNGVPYEHMHFQQGYKNKIQLLPPETDIVPNIPGQFHTFEWTVCVPDLPEGSHQTFPIIGRVEFDYASSAIATIPVLTRSEYSRRIRAGIHYPTETRSTNTRGPIHVTIDGEAPMIITSTRPGEEITSYRITFSNVGDGVPITDNKDGLLNGEVSINGFNAYLKECFGKKMPENTKKFIFKDLVYLRKGESITKGCKIAVSRDQWKVMTEDTITLIFDLNYRYYIQKTISITAYGQEFSPVSCSDAPVGSGDSEATGDEVDIGDGVGEVRDDAWCKGEYGADYSCEKLDDCGSDIKANCENDEWCCIKESSSGTEEETTATVVYKDNEWCREQAMAEGKANWLDYSCVSTYNDKDSIYGNSCVCDSGIPKDSDDKLFCDGIAKKCCIPAAENNLHATCITTAKAHGKKNAEDYRAVDAYPSYNCKPDTYITDAKGVSAVVCCIPKGGVEMCAAAGWSK
jgi:hypothetical protein